MKSMNRGLKCRVCSVRPTKDGEQWLPEKADSVARILFSDRSDRVADVIFFAGYPHCFRIRIYDPKYRMAFDFSAGPDTAYMICPVCHVFSAQWSELVVETLTRTGILRKGDSL